ncbi:TMV resistance protein N-like [Senna tora]|uniref:TMV resistance protein N-like n=1 Tax=Senna tora TaxID=362788 RepID=A0A834T613_9FABA|nr:TMV resistance protein N-like [Senna tora]
MDEEGDGENRGGGDELVPLEWNSRKGKAVGKKTLIGRLVTDRGLNRATEEDCERILRDGPWSVLGCLLNVKPWISSLRVEDVKLDGCPFWVQFHGLPLEVISAINAIRMGERIGEVLAFEDPFDNDKIARPFVRVRVLVNLLKPLLDGFWGARVLKDSGLERGVNAGGSTNFGCNLIANDEVGPPSNGILLGVQGASTPGRDVGKSRIFRGLDKSQGSGVAADASVGILGRAPKEVNPICVLRPDSGGSVKVGRVNVGVSSSSPSLSVKLDSDMLTGLGRKWVRRKGERSNINIPPEYIVELPAEEEEHSGCLALVPVESKLYEQDLVKVLRRVSLKRRGDTEGSPVRGKKFKLDSPIKMDEDPNFVVGAVMEVEGKSKASPGKRRARKVLECDNNWPSLVNMVDVPVKLLSEYMKVDNFVFGQGEQLKPFAEGAGGWPKTATKEP